MKKILINNLVTPISNYFFCMKQIFRNRIRIFVTLKLDDKKNITIVKCVSVHYKSCLAAMPLTGENVELVIEDGTIIGHFSHIYATKSIRIGKKVLVADKVYISDNMHCYENPEIAIVDQPIIQKNPVVIG